MSELRRCRPPRSPPTRSARSRTLRPNQPRVRLVDSGAPASAPVPNAPPLPTPADWELSFENALGAHSLAAGARGRPARARRRRLPRRPQGARAQSVRRSRVSEDDGRSQLGRARRREWHDTRSPAEPMALAARAPEPMQTMPMSPPVKQRPAQPVARRRERAAADHARRAGAVAHRSRAFLRPAEAQREAATPCRRT